ncbi:MAG: GNAT family N-acetyltransferase [Thermoanaerobaculia bacterium]
MTDDSKEPTIRTLEDADLGGIIALDEKINGSYRPDVWETRFTYYMRRDPEACLVADRGGRVVGFMLGDVRAGEFGLEEPTGWVEVLGVDPEERGRNIGRRLADRILDHFRAAGAHSVRTLVDQEMTGIEQFFTALGFAPAPVRTYVKTL